MQRFQVFLWSVVSPKFKFENSNSEGGKIKSSREVNPILNLLIEKHTVNIN